MFNKSASLRYWVFRETNLSNINNKFTDAPATTGNLWRRAVKDKLDREGEDLRSFSTQKWMKNSV